jgi:glycosyltransferase involved in cell wall biosynthesis
MAETVKYPEGWKKLRVALSHDWLTGMRGGEKCLELLGAGFPDAHLYCLLYKKGSVSDTIASRPIHTSWLQYVPGIPKYYRFFLPVFPLAIRTMGKPDADLLISTSHCAAKALPIRKNTRHLCYCFTPMRYAWTFRDEYFGASRLKHLLLAPPLAGLRAWDKSNSKGVHRFVGISHHVRKRIEQYYGREADVVYPPADTLFYTPDASVAREDFDLIVSALVPYKRVDMAVRAYMKSGRKLVVVGSGTEYEKLKSQSGSNISFLGWQSNENIRDLYRRCRFLIFPGEEDFGIVPVEAMACGTPVLAYNRGGATETVDRGISGLFFDEQSPEELNRTRDDAESVRWDHNLIRKRSERFSQQVFTDEIALSIDRCLQA